MSLVVTPGAAPEMNGTLGGAGAAAMMGAGIDGGGGGGEIMICGAAVRGMPTLDKVTAGGAGALNVAGAVAAGAAAAAAYIAIAGVVDECANNAGKYGFAGMPTPDSVRKRSRTVSCSGRYGEAGMPHEDSVRKRYRAGGKATSGAALAMPVAAGAVAEEGMASDIPKDDGRLCVSGVAEKETACGRETTEATLKRDSVRKRCPTENDADGARAAVVIVVPRCASGSSGTGKSRDS
mmetsp:Transcript_124096/g.310207  ORF Transcript_124096/g.310207 Transcript_124096/m.310207 type:complete len:236 (-) Transcript_124096:9-716(-)